MKKKQTESKSAFFHFRTLLALALLVGALSLSLFAAGVLPEAATPKSGGSTSASGKSTGTPAGMMSHGRVIVSPSIKNDVSQPLRDAPTAPLGLELNNCEVKENPPTGIPHITDAPDGALQQLEGPLFALQPSVPSATLNFEGIDFPGVVCSCNPPDTDGAVGLNQYVQEVNEGIQVFNKSTGASELGPIAIASLWNGFGGQCQNAGAGDGVVLYDHFANRWLISEFAIDATSGVPTHECVAISTSPDATGSYYRYDFPLTPFGNNYYDYPKIAVWPDGYYQSDNVFNSGGTTLLGPQPFAMNRANMLQGLPASIIGPVAALGSTVGPILPADIDGMTLPPSGAPETYIGFPTAGNYTFYHFHADFNTPANSTWTTFGTVAAAAFTQLCTGGRQCVPQSGGTGTNGLDGIGDRLMFRAAYRNFGTQASPQESLVTNFTVCATGSNCGAGTGTTGAGTSGIRWIEIQNVTNGPLTKHQESTYQPDTTWRWMGSIAMDNAGDMMLGFSASSSSAFPSIRYTGRLSTDTLNSMAQGEATLFSGTGSQSSSGNRWGDYSAMSVDPEDDCTFWYTQEYYPTGPSQFNWRTRVGNFVFSQCTPQTPSPVAAVSVYNVADFTSLNPGTTAGFTVTVNSSGTDTANGMSFSDPLPSGQGINWSITTPVAGWSITGSPPTQALAFSTTSMVAGTSSSVHIQSSTSSSVCGSTSLAHTATLTTTNAGTGFATASTAIDCTNCTPNAFTDNSPQAASPDSILDQSVAAIGTKFYQFPGIAGGAFGTVARVFDTNANTWSTITALSAANERESAVAVSDNSRYIYILNGLNSAGTAQSTNIEYDSTGNTYTTGAVTGGASWAAGAAYFNGKIYVMGGLNSAGSAAQTFLRIGTIGAGTPPAVTWAAGAALPVGVAWPQVAHINVGGTDYIYLSGGTTASTAQSAVYRYNIGTNTWSANLGNMPATIWSAANGVVNGYWVLAGGFVNGAASTAVYSYLPSSNTWTLNASAMPQPRARGSGGANGAGTALYSFGGMTPAGGFGGSTDNQAYNPSLCAPGLVSVVSRFTHGGSGTFDLPLSLSSRVVEPRSNGTSNFTIVYNFAVPVNSGTASVGSGTGSAGAPTFSGNSMIVPLTGVLDQQTVTLNANNVSGPGTGTASAAGLQIGFLNGDVNGDGVVNVGDTLMTRGAAGVTLDITNFQFDVNVDGMVNVGDTIVVRAKSGNFLP
jgi:uncharacterized repeat protein (TIGR01451 family)